VCVCALKDTSALTSGLHSESGKGFPPCVGVPEEGRMSSMKGSDLLCGYTAI
jgi:hypothetical protein